MGGGNELFFPIISQKEIHSGQEGDRTLRYLVGEGWRSLRTVSLCLSNSITLKSNTVITFECACQILFHTFDKE